MKKILILFLAVSLFTGCLLNVSADEDKYYVKDQASGLNEEFAGYYQALSFFGQQRDEYESLVLYHGDQVEQMAYGTLEFASEELTYYSVNKRMTSYLNGALCPEALYLREYDDDVYFYLEGDIGIIEKDKVTYHPYERGKTLSYYYVKDGVLYHALYSLRLGYYFENIRLCPSDSLNLKEGEKYLSYDGHFFYDDFRLMSEDLRSAHNDNAVNEDAFYNYYQYLPYRSQSSYTAKDFAAYFEKLGFGDKLNRYEDLSLDGANDSLNRSQLYKEEEAFLKAEELYGVNAGMLLAQAISESSFGKDLNSYMSNNFYEYVAYDSLRERELDRYSTLEDSVLSFAKNYVASRFTNYRSRSYAGSYFGDLTGGIAGSFYSDPLKGEKLAAAYFALDEALGGKDYQFYSLLYIDNRTPVYKADGEEFLYRTGGIFVIVNRSESGYEVIADYNPKESKEFSFVDNRFFIYRRNVDSLLFEGKTADFIKKYQYEEKEELDNVSLKGKAYLINGAYDVSELHFSSLLRKYPVTSEMFGALNEGQLEIVVGDEVYYAPCEEIEATTVFSFDEIRDRDLSDASRNNINSDIEGISVSGLMVGADSENFFDTWYFRAFSLSENQLADFRFFEDVYGLELVSGVDISLKKNLITLEEFDPLVVSIPLGEEDDDKLFTVYRLNEDGEFVKVRCQRRKESVQFEVREAGEYGIYRMASANDFGFEDFSENLSVQSAGPDSMALVAQGLLNLLLIIISIILIVIYYQLDRGRHKLWSDYKNQLLNR